MIIVNNVFGQEIAHPQGNGDEPYWREEELC